MNRKRKKKKILKELCGKIGTKVSVASPFICDYGRNIFMGIPYTETDLPIMLSKIAFFTTFFGSAIVSLLYSGMVPVVSAMEKIPSLPARGIRR